MNIVNSRKNKSFFLSLCAALLLVLYVFSFSGGVSLADGTAAAAEYSANITVTAYSRQGKTLNPISGGNQTLDDSYKYVTLAWSELSYFAIGVDTSSITSSAASFDYTLYVEYLQATAGSTTSGSTTTFSTESSTPVEVLTGTTSSLNDLGNLSLLYYIDSDAGVATDTSTSGNDWGLYRFSIKIAAEDITTATYYSYIYNVLPDAISNAPTFDYEAVSSKTSMNNAYQFSISDSAYEYVNENLIVWYAIGEDTAGNKYVLTDSDIGGSTYTEADSYTHSIYTGEIERTGKTFYFDSNGISGNWKVYCVVLDNTTDKNVTYTSDLTEVATVKSYSVDVVIWIIVAAAVVLVILTVVIIARSMKKEKVW